MTLILRHFSFTMIILVLASCNAKQPDYEVFQDLDSEVDNTIEAKVINDTLVYYCKGKLICRENEFKWRDSLYRERVMYFPLGRKREFICNQVICYDAKGQVIESKSSFYTCQKMGNNLLFTFCHEKRSNSCLVVLGNRFDTDFLPTLDGDTLLMEGNSFLIQDYKKYCVDDTFRTVLAPRYLEFFEGKHEYFYQMILVEYPNRYDFSLIE